jgi:glycosyltransferase involved in cell wall biosynthesis
LKIVKLVEASAAGVGRHVADLTKGLLDRGHEVHLVYSDARSDAVFHEDLERLAALPGFRRLRILMRRHPHARDLVAIQSLRRYLRTEGPFDLLHSHSTKAGLIGRLGLIGDPIKRLYTPNMFFTAEPGNGVLVRRAGALLESALSKLCDGVITVSREEYLHAIELGISPAKLCLIPNGAGLDAGSPMRSGGGLRNAWGLHDGEVCVGFVGRLAPQKSPETMLRSFASLPGRCRGRAKLVAIGDGPLAGPCRRLAAQLGIDARVVWLGEQDAKTLMHAFDVLALTSDAEGHPIVVLEALARGLPIVATNVGGISDTVRHGVNGFVAPVRGVPEIAAALETLINDVDLRERMGRASRVIARDFSVDRMVERTLAFYDQVVSGVWSGSAAQDYKIAALP